MTPVLLVDADRNFRQALAIALQLDGVPVETANDVEEARARVGSGLYHACLVDCLLPGADELFESLAGVAGMRVIGTGAYPEVLALARRRHPWLGTLQKPFPVAELEARLREEAA